MRILRIFLLFLCAGLIEFCSAGALVIQTDFGLKDGAVAEMKGVAFGVSSTLPIFDLSHENTPFDIWQAAYRLRQAAPYWPKGTVFVSVVDPGVGTSRKSVVLKSKSGHYFVSPDNGTLTLVAQELGIDSIREIDETVNRLQGSEKSDTFHGRDVYVYTGARLAAGVISYEQVGRLLACKVEEIPYLRARREGDKIIGSIPVLDWQYGNVWTNISTELFRQFLPKYGEIYRVTISHGRKVIYSGNVPYARTFGDVPKGAPLLYSNSMMNLSIALNEDDFAGKNKIQSGADWTLQIQKGK